MTTRTDVYLYAVDRSIGKGHVIMWFYSFYDTYDLWPENGMSILIEDAEGQFYLAVPNPVDPQVFTVLPPRPHDQCFTLPRTNIRRWVYVKRLFNAAYTFNANHWSFMVSKNLSIRPSLNIRSNEGTIIYPQSTTTYNLVNGDHYLLHSTMSAPRRRIACWDERHGRFLPLPEENPDLVIRPIPHTQVLNWFSLYDILFYLTEYARSDD